jgi:Tfp pilus assembly protein PilN
MLKPYFRINEVSGVNLTIASDASLCINVCVVKANANQVEIKKKAIGLGSLKQLKEALPAKIPVALNLAGKGTLVKKIQGAEEIDANNFAKILPNANYEDFYLQQFTSGAQSYIALIRKEEAEKWLQELADLGLEVLILSLGPFIIHQVFPQLNFYGEEIVFDGHQIQRNEQAEWMDYKQVGQTDSTFPVKLETEKIDEKLVLPYAAAFQLILFNNLPVISANVIQLQKKLSSALIEQKITVISIVTLMALFVLLLGNFFLFTHYTTQNDQLALRAGQTARDVTGVDKLNADIKHKEALLDTLGWDGGINKSVLIDRIAQLLPPEITWQEVAVNPVDLSHEKEQRNIHFLSRKIKVTGYSQKIIAVNEWMGRVKSLGWVKNVQMLNYNYNNEQNTGQFTVIIDY